MQPSIKTDLEGVAIIGLAGRFPGAGNPSEFWENLKNGVESISHFSVEELEVRDAVRQAGDPNYIRARGVLKDADLFDAGFFGIYPQEAKLMDPQHRVFLECCWEALEDAGHDPTRATSSVGVFGGCSHNSYFLTQVAEDREFLQDYAAAYQTGFYQTMLGAINDTFATRVSYKLNLQGPSVSLNCACSTSLVAVCQAYSNLLTYQCDVALAGGVSISFPQKRGYLYQAGGMASRDGHCRTFDSEAQGTVFGSGAGVVVLKRLEDAVADGDHIYAVIKGCAVNNDGTEKVGYTAPSVEGQAKVIALAQSVAGVQPRSITYIEAHGTATPLGDPIEVAALTQVFRASTKDRGFCAIGTGKTNIGHLDVAAGVTGLIKTCLSMRHRKLPPTLHFHKPNPRLNLDNSPFYVNTEIAEWKPAPGYPLRAGVSAFGVGGTNAHLVLEEAPETGLSTSSRPWNLVLLSARTAQALTHAHTRLAGHLRNTELDLSDVAYTLQTGRKPFEYRRALVCRNSQEAIHSLEETIPASPAVKQSEPAVHFLFPGQGVQRVNMGLELYQTEKKFRECVDHCATMLRGPLGCDIRTILYPPEPADPEAQQRLNQTCYAQPAIFTIEYALAQLWMHWGVQPRYMIGHSIGEFVCACLAGVFKIEEVLGLIAVRGRLMQILPGGAMLSVRLPEAEVRPMLMDGLCIAAVNAPSLSVVAGPFDSVDLLQTRLEGTGIACRRLQTSHAFHSSMMDPIVGTFMDYVRTLTLSAPRIPYVSCVTGNLIKDSEATSPEYWARHFRQPVRFSGAIQTLQNEADGILLEVGPGTTLQTLARQHRARNSEQLVISSLSGTSDGADSREVLQALGLLWTAGIEPDWNAFHEDERLKRVPLPTYPFERKSFWIEPSESSVHESTEISKPSAPEPQHREELSVTTQTPITQTQTTQSQPAVNTNTRRSRIVSLLCAIIQDLSGMDLAEIDPGASFLELGFDSLFLTQVTQSVQGQFNVKITFRQLLDRQSSIHALAAYLDENLPPSALRETALESATPQAVAEQVVSPTPVKAVPAVAAINMDAVPPAANSAIERLMKEQLQAMSQLMAQQLEALRRSGVDAVPPSVPAKAVVNPAAAVPTPPTEKEFKAFGPYKPIQAGTADDLDAHQRKYLDSLIERYTNRTKESKRLTQKYRQVLADPRVASGFRSQWKEIVYPIVTNRSHGSKLWDVDGNEYIDLLNGFGPIAFGHVPDFVRNAVRQQLEQGIEIGPQTPLAGPVAELLCELTGMERATFCNTGSEAVMAAMRLARTVTGRKKVVFFAGDYHGNFEEVLAKRVGRSESLRSGPIAPGITPEAVANVIVLEYATPESLAIIRKNASELAAVVVEPVQSRHPNTRPREFLQALRAITAASGTALIFDEIVTGFRVHLGGAQAMYGIRADMATYGKVLGGGFPIGAIAGKAAFMDALDGGMWSYGDDSYPETGVTFFAGTFVRHPLAMAAALAVLKHLKESGPALQEQMTARTSGFVQKLNAIFAKYKVPSVIETCGSWFYFSFPADFRFSSLLYYHLREKGVHILEGFPCFLTTAHSDADLDRVEQAFEESCKEMQEGHVLAAARVETAASPMPVKAAKPPADASAEPTDAPLTEAQLEIWLSTQLGPDAACAYNESFSIRLDGSLNEPALKESLQQILKRHQALRATFDSSGPRMRFAKDIGLEIPTVDLSSSPADQREIRLAELIDADVRIPFDLITGPVVRIRLVRLDQQSHVVLFTSHHIVCDGWSTNVIIDELAKTYSAMCLGKEACLDHPLSFGAYARKQEEESRSARMGAVEQYWLDQYRDPPLVLDLPADRPRPSVKSYRGSTYRFHIGPELHQKVKRSAAKQGSTLFAMLLAGFDALLFRLCNQNDVVIGVPAAAQSLLENQTLVGHCVNFLALRGRMQQGETFAQLLARTKQTLLDAYEHQTYTFGTLVRKLGLIRDPSRLPLIEVQFNLERIGGGVDFHGLKAKIDANPKSAVNFDLFLNVVETPEGLVVDCDYNTDLFDKETIGRWLNYHATLLEAAAGDMQLALSELPLLTDEERNCLIDEQNRTSGDYPTNRCIHQLVEEQEMRTPNAIAATFEDETVTYSELNTRANQLARYLTRHGVGPGTAVAICLGRSLRMLDALLGTLKCGAAYVPLDPLLPAERINFIIRESNVKVVLADERDALLLTRIDVRIICLDVDQAQIRRESIAPIARVPKADDLAYVIYTSGSTGKPKGVEITHRSVVNFLFSMRACPGMTAADSLLAVTTLSFDIAGLEMFLPLVSGARVVIASKEETMDGRLLASRLKIADITIMQATPATWRLLLESGWKPTPEMKMLCGGEALPRSLANRLLQNSAELWNMYGPTETTIWSAVSRVEPGEGPVLIGPPIANTQFYVLDKAGQLCPPGVPGELYIGGDGVARGYFNKKELTAEKFIADPFRSQPGARLYKTGDLVRKHLDGSIEFLGRLDHQVKLRGFRIELGEIEMVMAQYPGVREAVVAVCEPRPNDQRLVGYVEMNADEMPPNSVWREHLERQLPAYMVPSFFVRVDEFPRTPNGKINRRALQTPDSSGSAADSKYVSPKNDREELLAKICAGVLDMKKISVEDSLFELGVDSVRVFQIAARAAGAGLNITPRQIFQHRTIAAACAAIASASEEISEPIGVGLVPAVREKYKIRRAQLG